MVTTQDVIDAGEEAIRVADAGGHHELAQSARNLTESFRRIAVIEAEE